MSQKLTCEIMRFVGKSRKNKMKNVPFLKISQLVQIGDEI